jgi:hypothetical protein
MFSPQPVSYQRFSFGVQALPQLIEMFTVVVFGQHDLQEALERP